MQFDDAGVDVVGIQESRCRVMAKRDGKAYHMIVAAAEDEKAAGRCAGAS